MSPVEGVDFDDFAPPCAATQIGDVYDECASDPFNTTDLPIAALIAIQQVHATLAVAQAIVELTRALATGDPT